MGLGAWGLGLGFKGLGFGGFGVWVLEFWVGQGLTAPPLLPPCTTAGCFEFFLAQGLRDWEWDRVYPLAPPPSNASRRLRFRMASCTWVDMKRELN